ncbi:protein NO VEIN domain-containing protein [Actinokineospora inagensis]|uniref:protein NO VEIN domain-containing protein n=1 Tax=Actinokineospora inagensis TaxID=103730 RepID=UPI000414E57B|nr:DUF3883 domain-containing protein [Actinokineospora inagensis]
MVAAFEYRIDTLPTEEVFKTDLLFMASVLQELHVAESGSEAVPGELAPEISDAISVADRVAGRRRAGQGMRLSHAERAAIEDHSVALARGHLEAKGYSVRDFGATESYDLDARRRSERLYVEVKGTTSLGEEVILTKNEVDLNDEKYPNTMLIIVSGIHLDRTTIPPNASGGSVREAHPWRIAATDLTPISFRYRVNQVGVDTPQDR